MPKFAYIFFFTAMEHQLRLEEIEVDCYGSQAKVQNFGSTLFADTPTMIDKPVKEKKTILQSAKRFAEDLTSQEQLILTDKDETFEYEFGDADDDLYEDVDEDALADAAGEDDDAE